ncbi:SDR family oxidoreductase [Dyadobacter arcticus]|uniref:Nucleoside-diphosphate-sugar epimerase n=1 Tax=Dyadobacter arcticus TaxID=1078754 RepID=A0ABX0UNK2_9BACT|nr:aldehyde reductase [Dyadobacter arcticus]NIJ52656.1 nucleoside-diphosphate-sugar epimerase [Dyadobacter arcticus]
MENKRKVLLTGITGFVGSHTAIQLLQKGYQVIGTLRDMKRADSIKRVLAQHTSHTDNLSFEEADIQDESIWQKLMTGVDYVQHIASPFPKVMPKDENDLIIPARQGNINILSAASSCGVKRVVITSSTAAISYGQPKERRRRIFDETDWTDLNHKDDITPYYKSKVIAEQAAWNFIKNDHSGLELSVVCPGLILGPLLEVDFNASANVVIKLLDGSMPALPQMGFDMVDVRSIASLLILAMEQPQAANQRYIGSAGYLAFSEMAGVLKKTYPKMKIPSRRLPNFLVHILSFFDSTLEPVLLDLGTERKMNNSKAANELSWKPIKPEEAVLSSAASILQLGIVKHK